MGTILSENISQVEKQSGYMYNISDEFTSDETFNDGGGYTYPQGTNIYWTADGYWDCLAGTPVTGVKGSNEKIFRRGNVNLTADDIGALATDGNSAENTVSFESADSTSPASWTDVSVLTSGEKHKSLMNKISVMFSNIRHIYNNLLGTTDISSIGNGTVTGAISTLNSDFEKAQPTELTATLSAGETTLSFTDGSISDTATIDVYSSTYGVSPKNMTVSGTTLTLTFKAQSSDTDIKVVIR
jgi:hypothetical protein